MAIKSSELTAYLTSFAPPVLADDWDNIGFQIGDEDKAIGTVLIALEITETVIDEAISIGADYIITHHPMMFRPFKSIVHQDGKQKLARRLIKHDINYFVMHTNFDYLNTGTSDLMAKFIGLDNIKPLLIENRGGITCALGKIGELPIPMSSKAFAEKLCQTYHSDALKYSAPQSKPIQKIALISGSGMSYINEVAKFDIDAFVTGDVTYHAVMDSLHYGIAIYDVGHFESEVIFSEKVAEHLKAIAIENTWDIQIVKSIDEKTPFKFVSLNR